MVFVRQRRALHAGLARPADRLRRGDRRRGRRAADLPGAAGAHRRSTTPAATTPRAATWPGSSPGAPSQARAFNEVMHGHGEKVADWQDRLERQETGMCEFHCALARRDVFDRIGPLDEKHAVDQGAHRLLHDGASRPAARSGSSPSSVVTYVFPCRARPMTPGGLAVLLAALVERLWRAQPRALHREMEPDTRARLRRSARSSIYRLRRMQGILVPLLPQGAPAQPRATG